MGSANLANALTAPESVLQEALPGILK